jgi:TfoX/Sxy family transcriptional regulator of competence genes
VVVGGPVVGADSRVYPVRVAMPKPSEEVKGAFRSLVPPGPGIAVKPMFGHLAAFVNGNMFTGVFSEKLFVRAAGPERDRLLASGGEDFAPMPGRPMNGYVCLPADWRSDEDNARSWIQLALEKTSAMPPKQPGKRKASKPKPG